MNTTTVRTRSVLVLALLVFALFAASSAVACVVGTGTSASCTEAALDACLPGGGGFDGTVTFACGGSATITATTPKTINADTTIDGGGGGGTITISGGGPAGLFFAIAPFTVKNLDIGGNGGDGAIVQSPNFPAPLTVTNSVLFNNIIAIDNFGTVTVTNSTFSQNTVGISTNSATVIVDDGNFFRNGTGINSGGTVTVTNSTFGGNSGASGSGGDGAAINSSGSLTVANSTFSGNTATNNGGAIFASGATTVSDSTFFGNTTGTSGAGGAIDVVGSGSLDVINCTLSGNGAHAGAAIANNASGPVTVVNSILANPSISLSLPGGNCSGTITDDGHNIDDGTTCGFTGTGCAATTGTSFCSTNPQLGPLQDNGGPTQTIALEAGSPAINAGDETICAAPPVNNLDQRGVVRPGAGATNCSIGAYEFNSARCGDVNGDGVVNIGDALVVAQFDVGLRQCGVAPFSHPEVCDVNRDGACNIGDALRMAQCDVGLISCAFTCTPFVCH